MSKNNKTSSTHFPEPIASDVSAAGDITVMRLYAVQQEWRDASAQIDCLRREMRRLQELRTTLGHELIVLENAFPVHFN